MLCNEKLNIKAYYNKGTCNNVLFIGTHTMNKKQNEQINIALHEANEISTKGIISYNPRERNFRLSLISLLVVEVSFRYPSFCWFGWEFNFTAV